MRLNFAFHILLFTAVSFSSFSFAGNTKTQVSKGMELGGTLLSLGYRSDFPDKIHTDFIMDGSKKDKTISVKARFTEQTDSLTATFITHSDDKQVKWQHIRTKDNQSALISLPAKAGVYRMLLAWAHQPDADGVLYYKNFYETDVIIVDELPRLTIPHQPPRWTDVAEDSSARSRLATIAWGHPNLGVDYIETSINDSHKERVTLENSEYQKLNFKTKGLWQNGQCLTLKAEVVWLNGSRSAESFDRCFNSKKKPVVNYTLPLPNRWVGDIVSLEGKVISELPLQAQSVITAARVGHENEPGCSSRVRPDDDGRFFNTVGARSCGHAEGEWRAWPAVTDKLGNTADDSETNRLRWSVDLTPPSISLNWPQIPGSDRLYHNGKFTVWGNALDTGSQLARVSSFVDQQEEKQVPVSHDGTFKAEVTLPTEASYKLLTLRAWDQVGNVTITPSQKLYYDGQAPYNTWQVPAFSRGQPLWLSEEKADIVVTANDQLSGTKLAEIAWKEENGAWSTPVPMLYQSTEKTWTHQLALKPDRFYHVRVRSHDYAGNVSAWVPEGTVYYKSDLPRLNWPDNALEAQPGKLTIHGQVQDTLLDKVKAWVEYCNAVNEASTCLRSKDLAVDSKGFFTAELTEPMLSAFKNMKIRLRAADVLKREAPLIDDKIFTPMFSEFSLASIIDDRDQSGGITLGDKVTLKLAITAAADSDYVSLKLMLPPGLNSDISEGAAIQIDPDSHITPGNTNAITSALNLTWTGQGNNDLLATGSNAPHLKAGDRILLNIPLNISESRPGMKLVLIAKIDAVNNPREEVSVRSVVETQSMYPAARAIKTDIFSPTVKPYERLPLGTPFVYRLSFDGGEWAAQGAQLEYKLPALLQMNGRPVVTENTTSVFIGISDKWDGRQNTQLFSEATLVKPGETITVDVPVKLDPDNGGELKSIVTATAANVTGKQQKVHCVYAEVGDVYVHFDLCSQPVK